MSSPVMPALPLPAPAGAAPRLARVYALEAWYEFLKILRVPMYSVSTLAFPVLFYLLFGIGLNSGRGSFDPAVYLLASYSVFGILTASLFAFGAGVAADRALGWMLLKQAAPMPPGAFLAARVATCMVFGLLIVALLGACGVAFGGVRLPAGAWLRLVAVVMLGCVPFCLAGLTIGYLAKPQAAPAIVNLINLPLSFASGLWIPVQMLPAPLQSLAPWLPPYHLGQLSWQALDLAGARGSVMSHVAALIATTALMAATARWAYRRGSTKELW